MPLPMPVEVTSGGGVIQQTLPDIATSVEFSKLYTAEISPGDYLFQKATSNGQFITALSASPYNAGTESSIYTKPDIYCTPSCAFEAEASLSIRARHCFAALGLFENDPILGASAVPDDINVVSCYQSSADFGVAYNAVAGTIITIVLESPFLGYLSDWVNINGLVDNRLNYCNLAVKYISYDRKTITAGFSDESALPSLAVPVITPTLGTVKLKHYNNMSGAKNGIGMRFTGTTTTNAAIVSIFSGNDVQVSGTLVGDHRVTTGSTAAVYTSGVSGQVEIKATNRFRLEVRSSEASVNDKAIDSSSAQWSNRAIRGSVKPPADSKLRPRFRIYKAASATIPVAKITGVSRVSNVVTVTIDRTCAEADIVDGNSVTAKGVASVTNFANFATALIVSGVSGNTFTIPWTGADATSYGGIIVKMNGGVDQQGVVGQTISNVIYDLATDTITLTGNTTWVGGAGVMNVGDYMELAGVRKSNGSDLGIDGCWECANFSTTTLVLKGVSDISNTRISPAPGADIASVAAGGCVIMRVTARVHDVKFEQWKETVCLIDGQGTTRLDKAVPTYSLGGTYAVTSSVATDTAAPNPINVGGKARSSNPVAMSASGDLVDVMTTMIGAVVVRPNSIPESDWSYAAAASGIVNTTTAVTIKAAAAAGVKNYLTSCVIQWEALGAATEFVIRNGAAGTVLFRIKLPTSSAGYVNVKFDNPLVSSAATLLEVATLTASVTGAVYFNGQGYIAP